MSQSAGSTASGLYRIAPSPDGFFLCGETPSEEQVLLGVKDDTLLALFFSTMGELLRFEERRPDGQIAPEHSGGADQFQASIQMQSQLQDWQEELQLTPDSIQVRRFFLPDLQVGISGMPDAFLKAFQRRPNMNLVEQAEFDRKVLEWKRDRRFVFWWNQELWMNEQGEITDTSGLYPV